VIINSICPHINGKFDVKLSLILTLIGGITRFESNTRIRGQCHILIIGEAGQGKS